MIDLFYFIKKRKYFFVFLFLEIIASVLIIKSYYFHNTMLLNGFNSIAGELSIIENKFSKYLTLDRENQRLLTENANLKTKLSLIENIDPANERNIKVIDSSQYQRYRYIPARIIWNSINKNNNYLHLNKGKRDHIHPDMAVITDKGIIGIIDYTTQKFSRAISILNKNIRVDGNIKHKGIFGTITWDGRDPGYVQLTGLPKHLVVKINDTVLTSKQSQIFPSGIPIGVIKDFKLKEGQNEYIAEVKLFEDFSKIKHAYIITDLDKAETDSLYAHY